MYLCVPSKQCCGAFVRLRSGCTKKKSSLPTKPARTNVKKYSRALKQARVLSPPISGKKKKKTCQMSMPQSFGLK
jgi:hypothetical protein